MPQFSFEQYSTLSKLDKDANAEDYSKQVDEMNDLDFDSLVGKFGADVLPLHTVVELKEELKRLDLSIAGRKQDLVDRLTEHYDSAAKKRKHDAFDQSDEKKQKVDTKDKNLGNVIGGYKATVHNPNVSDEAKEHAQELLDEAGVDADEKAPRKTDDSAKDENRVIGGYKATLSNHNSSDEAKEHARKELEKLGADPEERASSKPDYSTTDVDMKNKDETHVIAGYKATLSNDSASKEAKDHARKVLEEMGVDPEERLAPKTDYSTTEVDTTNKDEGHVVAGYKATLSNEKSSEEAKEHARKVLKEMGVDAEERASDHRKDGSDKDQSHVIGGYKATLSNDHASKEAKDHARKALEEMGVDPEARVEHGSEYAGQTTADGRNLGNVVGGYKATLSNPLASDEAKEGARTALDQIANSQ